MYAAVPRITPSCVIAGLVIVGDCDTVGDATVGSIAFASPKSSTFTVPSVAHFDVGRFQIAVDDALLVRRFQSLGNLPRDRQRLVERDRALRDAVGQRRPLDQLQHQRRTPPLSSKPWMPPMFG